MDRTQHRGRPGENPAQGEHGEYFVEPKRIRRESSETKRTRKEPSTGANKERT